MNGKALFARKFSNLVRNRRDCPRRTTHQTAFHKTIADEHELPKPQEVPLHVLRPPYAGQSQQDHPSFEDKISIWDNGQLEKIQEAATLASDTLTQALKEAKAGVSLNEIDKIVHDLIISDGGYPSALDFHHFPKSCCLSVNDVTAHGVPNSYVLQEGDWLNIDIVAFKNGFHGDNSAMIMIGEVDDKIQTLSQVARECTFAAISECKPGTKFNKMAKTVQEYARDHGFHVCPRFGGHGIGDSLHMAPFIHYTQTRRACKEEMRPGMVFTVEPVIMMNSISGHYYVEWRDNWSVQLPGNPSAYWEHMVQITEDGNKILTMREGETVPDL